MFLKVFFSFCTNIYLYVIRSRILTDVDLTNKKTEGFPRSLKFDPCIKVSCHVRSVTLTSVYKEKFANFYQEGLSKLSNLIYSQNHRCFVKTQDFVK